MNIKNIFRKVVSVFIPDYKDITEKGKFFDIARDIQNKHGYSKTKSFKHAKEAIKIIKKVEKDNKKVSQLDSEALDDYFDFDYPDIEDVYDIEDDY